MNYFIKRDTTEYGPYSLGDLQRYVAQGNIALTDLTRSEGLNDWVPVSQVIGNIPLPSLATAASPGSPGYGTQPGYGVTPSAAMTPVPPDFHWALVLLIGFVSCGIFFWVWSIVEAAWIRKIKPSSNAMALMILATVLYYAGAFANGFIRALGTPGLRHFSPLFPWVGAVVLVVGFFQMNSDMEDYYNSTENIGLRLSGAMTFFFGVFYFQHHFSRIAKWKNTGMLEPQY